MAPKPYPSNGTDWSSWTLSDMEKRAADFEGALSAQFRRALAAARAPYAEQARRVPCRPLAWGITVWGPIPHTRDAHIMWDGPGSGLMWYATNPDKPGAVGMPIRHRAVAGPFDKRPAAISAARRFIAIGLDDIARGEREEAARGRDDA